MNNPPLSTAQSAFWLGLALSLWSCLTSQAQPVTLAPYYSSNMVLQRGSKTRIWGSGPIGKWIKVEFSGKRESADVKKNGIWTLELEDLKATPVPESLAVYGPEDKTKPAILLTNVLVGDVFIVGIAEGTGINIPTEPLLNCANPVRILNIPRLFTQTSPLDGHQTGWTVPGEKVQITAMAFHTADRLTAEQEMKGVPLGVLVTDLLPFKRGLKDDATDHLLPDFAHDAWVAATNDFALSKQKEIPQLIQLKREGQVTDKPPLRDYERMHIHSWEDFDPKLPPASVINFKGAFNALF